MPKSRVVFRDYSRDVQRRLTKMARASISVDTGASRRTVGRERVSDTKVIVGALTRAAFFLETRADSPKWETHRWLGPAFEEGREAASTAAVAAATREARRP
ncbi:hypothetical protein [Candidatus Palauibacter sp.]|uniref:hypothetical protein n=1 Tax=Candidatus Palauibacter sp. TaxID=3101350 RepID=UPI003B01469D